MNPPTIAVKSIPEEGLSLKLALSHDWLRDILEGSNVAPFMGGSMGDSIPDGEASLRLDEQKSVVTLSGSVGYKAVGECVSCLAPVVFDVRSEFQLVLMPVEKQPPRRPNEEFELHADELDLDYYDNASIDLARWLRQEILLETPLHPRHEGRCPSSPLIYDTSEAPRDRMPCVVAQDHSGEKPIDPRLLPLMKFVKKE